ncbi:MAG: ATP-binding protein [Candidatus Omnitrophica bacterium]|nr:ATP-binding protein [Candidatus Omnitrophota bacterium]MCG2707498.1 ATP-binding protein [Candidatus Omnitrophota bacterium]
MNRDLIEQLLNESESSVLDFKESQYPFEKASDEQKSELLKDILAFSNAWRRSDAYIMIGVKEVKGGRSIVMGIDAHIDEAKIQQFVNIKTNKPLLFSCVATKFEGKQLAIIKIPIQEKPVYITKDFGSLKKEVVYIRRGTSTAIASPDEIYKMGLSSAEAQIRAIADFEFGDKSNQVGLGTSLAIECSYNEVEAEPQLQPDSKNSLFSPIKLDIYNEPKYKDYAEYVVKAGLLRPILFVIRNTGDNLLENAKLKINFSKDDNLILSDRFPECPMRKMLYILPNISIGREVFVYRRKNDSEVKFNIGNIQPKDMVWSDQLFVGSKSNTIINCSALLFADNLPNPVSKRLEIKIDVERRFVSAKDIQKMMTNG